MKEMSAVDNRPCLDLASIPDRAFIPVIRKRNILKAQINSKGSSKYSIRIQSPMGDYQDIQRKELLENYRYLQNKKINLHGWKSDTYYTIFMSDNSKMYAMQVPLSVTAYVNGVIANTTSGRQKGDYIVCYGGADGKIDKRTAKVIQATTFHKMFSIPKNEIIMKYRGKSKNKLKKAFTPPKRYLVQPGGPSKITHQQKTNRPIDIKTDTQNKNKNTVSNQIKPTPTNPTYRVNAATLPGIDSSIARPMGTPKQNPVRTVGKLLRGQILVGFVIQDGQRVKQVNTNQMKIFIANGIVTDVMVQKNAYGMEYFRGNGIQIEQLPVKQV